MTGSNNKGTIGFGLGVALGAVVTASAFLAAMKFTNANANAQ